MADNFLMKGKVFSEREHLLQYPAIAEVKYDEVRLHVHGVMNYEKGYVDDVLFLSYAGKPLYNFEHWKAQFIQFFRLAVEFQDLDLGVLVNGNFNDSYRWVRSAKGIPKEKFDKVSGKTFPALDPSMVEFYLFDVPGKKGPLGERLLYLDAVSTILQDYLRKRDGCTRVNRPARWEVKDRAELDQLFNAMREQGYEGLMVKDLRGEYISGSGHRSDWWLKMKPEAEEDGIITGLNRAVSIHGEPLDRIGSIDVEVLGEVQDGVAVKAASRASPAGIDHTLGADMFQHPEKYLGRWVEFKYMERDRQGGYRHPSFVRFREDKA